LPGGLTEDRVLYYCDTVNLCGSVTYVTARSLSPRSCMTVGASVSVRAAVLVCVRVCVCVCVCRGMWHSAVFVPPLARTGLSFPNNNLQQKEKKNEWGGCHPSGDQKWLLHTKEEGGQLSPCQAPPAALPSLPAHAVQAFSVPAVRARCCCGLPAGAGHSLSIWISIPPL